MLTANMADFPHKWSHQRICEFNSAAAASAWKSHIFAVASTLQSTIQLRTNFSCPDAEYVHA